MVHTLQAMTDDQLADSNFFATELLTWFEENGRDFAWRQTHDPYRVLICEVLLRRSRSSTVAKVADRFFERWPSAGALGDADVEDVTDVIRPLGLIKRAPQLVELGQVLEGLSRFPDSIELLTELPGVGRYAAAATLGEPTVDGTSARVYRRYFGWLDATEHKTVDAELWKLVDATMPLEATAVRRLNWAVLDLAASYCAPARPLCDRCPLVERCQWTLISGRDEEPSDSPAPVNSGRG